VRNTHCFKRDYHPRDSAIGSGLAARSRVNAFTLCDGYRGKPVTAIGQILRVANTDR
jgi:hypothetical protein